MNDLIKITKQEDGRVAVSARELHKFLNIGTPFHKWIVRMLEYGFKEGHDWTFLSSDNEAFNVEYVLSLDCAKHISMIQRTPQGMKAREYFIEVEKRFSKPANVLDWLQESLNVMKNHTQEINQLKHQVKEIEAKTTTRPEFYAVSGFAILNGLSVGRDAAIALGKKASAICKEKGIQADKIRDPKYGHINAYPYWVLEDVFRDNGLLN